MDDLISTADAAKLLGVTPRAVRRYYEGRDNQRKLPGREIAGTLLFLRADVEAFVKPTMGRPKKKPGAAPAKKPAAKKRKGKGA